MNEPYARFIRHTLGCTCPEEVFQNIRVATGLPRTEHPPYVEITAGDRLLVRLLEWDGPDPAQLAALLTAGRADRDARGFNRFRLVVATEHPGTLEGVMAEALRCTPDLDDRTHLHVVARDEVTGLISPVAEETYEAPIAVEAPVAVRRQARG